MAGISTSIIVPRGAWTPQSDGRGPGDHAAGSGVQQRGHAPLLGGRRARDGQEYPGQQPLPRPAGAQPRSRWRSALVVIPCAITWLRLMT